MASITTVRELITARLQALSPVLLEIMDDSASHTGHAGAAQHAMQMGLADVASAQSHFEITIVSAAFAGKPLVARHRMVYALLDDLMKTRIHALKIDARTV